jgi:hypothetical protein
MWGIMLSGLVYDCFKNQGNLFLLPPIYHWYIFKIYVEAHVTTIIIDEFKVLVCIFIIYFKAPLSVTNIIIDQYNFLFCPTTNELAY